MGNGARLSPLFSCFVELLADCSNHSFSCALFCTDEEALLFLTQCEGMIERLYH